MAQNPYEEDIKRRAQVGILGGGAPAANTMPVGAPVRQSPAAPTGRPSWHVDPTNDLGTLQGFDAGNMADPTMQSVKYRHGRLARGVTRPSEMAALVQSQAYQQAFPGATFDGKDRVNFMGALSDGDRGSPVGIIDVLRAADRDSDVSQGGWWGYEPDGTPSPPPPGASARPGGLNPAGDNSALARIMAELSATSNGEESPAEREAMLALLQGL